MWYCNYFSSRRENPVLKAACGLVLALSLGACSDGSDNRTDAAGGSPFQEIIDQGVTRYLGVYSPMMTSEEGGVVNYHFGEGDGPLCLDVSHLWISCLLFGRDFGDEVTRVAQTGRLACVHLHANPVAPDADLAQLRDGHVSLTTPNRMDLPRVVRILRQFQVNHLVLETPQADLGDLQLLADWLE